MKQKTPTKTNRIHYLLMAYLLVIFFSVTPAFATTYYVDNNSGNDLNSGLAPATAWQTLLKVNTFTLLPGDSILFHRTGQWRGQLFPQSGNATSKIVYGAYGTGAKPEFLGSLNKSNISDWVYDGNNTWHCVDPFVTDIGNMIFNNATSFGIKKWTSAAMTQQGDFWFDKTSYVLRMYSVANPATIYQDIECALRLIIIDQDSNSYISYNNLSLKYGGAHGIGGSSTHHINISECDISFIGGGDQDGINNIRYGNGVEFWADAHDNEVERCRIWEIYDSGVTNQNNASTVQQYNITYRNNIIWNCAMSSFEYFNHSAASTTSKIIFENNTCLNAGYGWGVQRPDPVGAHVLFKWNAAINDSLIVRNNIFYNASRTLIFIDATAFPLNELTLNYNFYLQNNDSSYFWLYPVQYDSANFSTYQTNSGYDLNSFIDDPLFVNYSNNDFHITSTSPVINQGFPTNNLTDFDNEVRIPGSIDIGADEYYPNTSVVVEPLNKQLFFIHPNPATETLTIKFTDYNRKEQVQIFNSIGVLIKEIEITQTIQVNIADLPKGLYFIHLKNQLQPSLKFIKQ